MKKNVSVIITDLDNTLFDWFDIWYKSFNAMLSSLVNKSGIPQDKLEEEFMSVHQKHGTSEYAFSLEELPSLQKKHPDGNIPTIYNECIQAYRQARQTALKLYPDVLQTLCVLRSTGCLLVGYTESMGYYSKYRIKKLGLDGILDYLYSTADHDIPKNIDLEKTRAYGPDRYKFQHTIHRHTPKGEIKPNSELLNRIIKEVEAAPEQVIYVGDSLMKDVAMAQRASVTDVWAKYGVPTNDPRYDLLRKVTHWKKADVEREKQITDVEITANFVLESSFKELLDLFNFVEHVDGFESTARLWESKGYSKNELIGQVVSVWEKTIDVQQHFNDLCLRIRNYAITVLTAILGLSALSLKEGYTIVFGKMVIPLASILMLLGAISWVAFYLMDRHWYHVLLNGAVKHGMDVEKFINKMIPKIGLTQRIGEESPVTIPVLGIKVHSKGKFWWFYGPVFAFLLIAAVAIYCVHKDVPKIPDSGSENTNIVNNDNASVQSRQLDVVDKKCSGRHKCVP